MNKRRVTKNFLQKKPVGQIELFTGIVNKQTPREQVFAEKLYSAGLIPATVRRKRRKKGRPMTINVKTEVSKAAAVLLKVKGVNLNALCIILKSKERPSVESVLKRGVVAAIKRSPEEQKNLKDALEVIIYFANRNKDRKDIAKKFAPDAKEKTEKNRQKRHLKDITGS